MHTRLRRLTPQRGFTLIEILTVLAIIGILTAILIPAVSKAQERSRLTAVVAEIRTLKTIVSEAANQLGGSLPETEGLAANPRREAKVVFGTNPADGANYTTPEQRACGLTASKLLRLDHVLISLKPPLMESYWTTRFGGGKALTSSHLQPQPRLYYDSADQKFKTASAVQVVYSADGNYADYDYSSNSRIECAKVVATTFFNIDAPNTVANSDSNDVNVARGINFDLDGNGVTAADLSVCAYVVYKRVSQRDAYQLALALNGPLLMDNTSSDGGSAQKRGLVIYAAPSGGLVENVFVFLAQF